MKRCTGWKVITGGLLRVDVGHRYRYRPYPERPKDGSHPGCGCGTGATREALVDCGLVFGADMSAEALMFSRSRSEGPLTQSRVERLSFVDGCFDLITALDVLEHADDDIGFDEELYRALRPGGVLVVTVPAYGFLWSEQTKRCSTADVMRRTSFATNLLAPDSISSVSATLLRFYFPRPVMRFIQNIFKKSVEPKTSHVILPEWINNGLIGLLGIERWLMRYIIFIRVRIVCRATTPSRRMKINIPH